MKASDWSDYVIDSLEVEESHAPLVNVRQVPADTAIDPATVRRYFAENAYPYSERIDIKTYYREKLALQIELVKLQNWVKDQGRKIVMVFEGRDAAGKGSTIQRYFDHLPTAGEIVFFDRSWYNRAGVEPVMGFCSDEEYDEFVRQTRWAPELMLHRPGPALRGEGFPRGVVLPPRWSCRRSPSHPSAWPPPRHRQR